MSDVSAGTALRRRSSIRLKIFWRFGSGADEPLDQGELDAVKINQPVDGGNELAVKSKLEKMV